MRLIDADDLENVVMQLNKEGRTITRNEYKVIDNILFEFPTIDAVPTDFHDKCMEIEISKRINIEKKMKKMESENYETD